MAELQMGAIESRFADIIWDHEPISSGILAKYSEEQFKWKKTTSFTVLKRLCDKGIFQNNKGIVTSLISRDEFYSMQSEKFVDETFEGSLPAFIAAFASHAKLKKEDADKLMQMIDEFETEE